MILPVRNFHRVLMVIYHEPATAALIRDKTGIPPGDINKFLHRAKHMGLIQPRGLFPQIWDIAPGKFEAFMIERGAAS